MLEDQDESQLTEAGENPLVKSDEQIRRIEGAGKIRDQVAKVRAAWNRAHQSYFDLAEEIIRLREVITEVRGTAPTREQLAKEMGLGFSGARVSQLTLTAEMFRDTGHVEGIDFKVYEVARETNANRLLPLAPEALAEVVKANPSSGKVRTALTKTDAIIAIAAGKGADDKWIVGDPKFATDARGLHVVSHGQAGILLLLASLQELASEIKPDDSMFVTSELSRAPQHLRLRALHFLLHRSETIRATNDTEREKLEDWRSELSAEIAKVIGGAPAIDDLNFSDDDDAGETAETYSSGETELTCIPESEGGKNE